MGSSGKRRMLRMLRSAKQKAARACSGDVECIWVPQAAHGSIAKPWCLVLCPESHASCLASSGPHEGCTRRDDSNACRGSPLVGVHACGVGNMTENSVPSLIGQACAAHALNKRTTSLQSSFTASTPPPRSFQSPQTPTFRANDVCTYQNTKPIVILDPGQSDRESSSSHPTLATTPPQTAIASCRMFALTSLMEYHVALSFPQTIWSADLHRNLCESEFVWT
jgi:hypothetical protein